MYNEKNESYRKWDEDSHKVENYVYKWMGINKQLYLKNGVKESAYKRLYNLVH